MDLSLWAILLSGLSMCGVIGIILWLKGLMKILIVMAEKVDKIDVD